MVQGAFFDSNCVEMGAEAVEMDKEDGKLQNDIRLVSTERSRDELFTSEHLLYKFTSVGANVMAFNAARICF